MGSEPESMAALVKRLRWGMANMEDHATMECRVVTMRRLLAVVDAGEAFADLVRRDYEASTSNYGERPTLSSVSEKKAALAAWKAASR